MSDDSSDQRRRLSDLVDDGELELDTDRNTGNWRGVVPGQVRAGSIAQTLDPEAKNLDPDDFDYIRSAAMKRVTDVVPAEVAQPHPDSVSASDPSFDPFEGHAQARSGSAAPAASAPSQRPDKATGRYFAPTPSSSRSVQSAAPWEMQDEQRKRNRALIVIGVAVGLVVLAFVLFGR